MKKFITKVLILLLMITFLFVPDVPEIRADLQSDLNDAEDRIKELQRQKEETEEKIKSLLQQSADLEKYIAGLDREMSELDAEIADLDQKIIEKQEDIAENTILLNKAKQDRLEQYAAMKLRIQYMYEQGSESYLDMLFLSKSMGELLSRVEYISKINKYDRDMLEKFILTEQVIQDTQAVLESEQEELEAMWELAQVQKDALTVLVDTKNAEMQNLKNQTEQATRFKEQIDEAREEEERQVNEIKARIAEEERNGNGLTFNGEKFLWPTPSKRITSYFGETEGRTGPHNGLDIGGIRAGVSGDPIMAAAAGRVEISTYSPSAGYYVMIYHGDGVYTRYLHCSRLPDVKVGTMVKRGDIIGYMGTTGNSTGVHLHFDITIGGSYVDPLLYLER